MELTVARIGFYKSRGVKVYDTCVNRTYIGRFKRLNKKIWQIDTTLLARASRTCFAYCTVWYSLTQWLIPKDDEEGQSNKKNSSSQFVTWIRSKTRLESLSWRSLRNQWQLAAFLMAILAANIVLLVTRASEFVGMSNLDGGQNYFYLLSRACGNRAKSSVIFNVYYT